MSSTKNKLGNFNPKLILVFMLCWAFTSSPLFAKDGKKIAFVSSSNAGFEKDVKKNLRKDSRRTKTELSVENLNEFLKSDLAAYDKIAIIAYTSDLKGDLLAKIQELQAAQPSKCVIWLTYKGKKAPKTPKGIDATSSASTQSYSEKGYGKSIMPHLFG